MESKRKKVYRKCNGHCGYCGKPVAFEEFTIDHIKPVKIFKQKMKSLNGIENLMPSCVLCNSRKGHLDLETLRKTLKRILKIKQFYFETLGV